MGNAYGRMLAMALDPNTPVELLAMVVGRIARSEWILAVVFLIYFAINLSYYHHAEFVCKGLDDDGKEKKRYDLSCEEYLEYLQALSAVSFILAMLYLFQAALLGYLASNYRTAGGCLWNCANAMGMLIFLCLIAIIYLQIYTTSIFWVIVWVIIVISNITRIRVIATIGRRCVLEGSNPQLPQVVAGPAVPAFANATPIAAEAEYAPTPIVVHAVAVPANSK